MMKPAIATLLSFLITLSAFGQHFYVNTGGTVNNPANTTYRLNTQICDTLGDTVNLTVFTCPATYQPNTWIDSSYNDIAIDKDDNLWYVTLTGYLYKRKLNDTSTCKYIGDFAQELAAFTSLVADSSGNIYAAANITDSTVIYRYNSNNGFTKLGLIPNVHSSGDLFFYEHRLFMTSLNADDDDTAFITEVVLKDPTQSCYYMPLGKIEPFGAFSIKNGNKTKVYISDPDTTYTSTDLIEVDIPNKKLLGIFCTYPFLIKGAAYYYELTGDSTHCPYIPNLITALNGKNYELKVLNPTHNQIRIHTNLSNTVIKTISLYDLSGRKVKSYMPTQFPDKMDITQLPEGMYIIQIATTDGMVWNEKVIK